MNAAATTTKPFLPERTALRGLCMSEVVLSHCLQWFGFGIGGIVVLAVAANWLVGFVANLGLVAVGTFMCLSIFLLMGSLDANYNLKRYFLRRMRRTWPLYFVVCVLVFALMDPNWTTLLYNFAFLPPFFPAHTFQVPYRVASSYVLWNIQIEEWAYLFFPLIALLAHRGRIAVGFALVGVSLVGDMLGQLGTTGVFVTYVSPWPWLVCFGVGLLAYEARGDWQRWRWPLLAIMVVSVMTLPWPWLMIAAGPFCAWLVAYPPNWMRRFAFVVAGECSYAIYLIHMMFIDFLGPVGAPFAFLFGYMLEKLQRGNDMAKNLKATKRIFAERH